MKNTAKKVFTSPATLEVPIKMVRKITKWYDRFPEPFSAADESIYLTLLAKKHLFEADWIKPSQPKRVEMKIATVAPETTTEVREKTVKERVDEYCQANGLTTVELYAQARLENSILAEKRLYAEDLNESLAIHNVHQFEDRVTMEMLRRKVMNVRKKDPDFHEGGTRTRRIDNSRKNRFRNRPCLKGILPVRHLPVIEDVVFS